MAPQLALRTRQTSANDAKRHTDEALALYRELGDEAGVARCEWALGNILWGFLVLSLVLPVVKSRFSRAARS